MCRDSRSCGFGADLTRVGGPLGAGLKKYVSTSLTFFRVTMNESTLQSAGQARNDAPVLVIGFWMVATCRVDINACYELCVGVLCRLSIMNPLNPPQSTPTIRLPMLGHQLNPNHQQQQQLPGLNPNHHQQQPPNHGQQGPIQPPPPQSGQDFTLSSVLHFLQTEWRRYERDRNEWEIERAEMRVCLFIVKIASSHLWYTLLRPE